MRRNQYDPWLSIFGVSAFQPSTDIIQFAIDFGEGLSCAIVDTCRLLRVVTKFCAYMGGQECEACKKKASKVPHCRTLTILAVQLNAANNEPPLS
jgi:hypothetical protein